MPRPNIVKMQKMVDDWNRFYPAGTRIIVRKDSGEKVETVTTSQAELLGGHTPVIWCKGIRGAYALSRVEPVE